MNDHVAAFMDKARDSLGLARLAADAGFAEGAVSRAYYAAFYAARAALLLHGEVPRTHAGAHNRFWVRFVKTGLISETTGGVLPYAFTMRQKADYDAMTVLDVSAAYDLIADVEAFVQAVESLLQDSRI